jgi:hypothetical protein
VVTICTASLTFSNSTFCPHSVFMCFVWVWEQTAIISLYNINWQVFITELTLYSPVVTICTTSLTFNNSTFCPHSVFMCFVWVWEQTAITRPRLKPRVFQDKTQAALHGVRWCHSCVISQGNSLQFVSQMATYYPLARSILRMYSSNCVFLLDSHNSVLSADVSLIPKCVWNRNRQTVNYVP